MLKLKGVQSGYEKMKVLQGVDIDIQQGEIVSIIGKNGVGKSTLIKTIIGLNRTWNGMLKFDGQDITKKHASYRACQGIAYVPQGHGVFPQMTVEENLKVGCLSNHSSKKNALDIAYSYFPKLEKRKKQFAGTMSGGEQAMLSIARALTADPKLILLDEPSEGVQPNVVFQMGDILKKISCEIELTVLLVEQNLGLIQQISNRSYAMDKGMIVAELTDKQLNDAHCTGQYLTV